MDRRTLLALAGTTLVAASAGCNDGSNDDGSNDDGSNDDGSNDDNETDNSSENSTGDTNSSEVSGDDTTDETDNGDDTTGEYTDESGRMPAAVVRGFYEAVETGDADAMSALLHENVAGDASEELIADTDREFLSVETTVVDDALDPLDFPITRVPDGERVVLVRAEPTVRDADGTERTLIAQEFLIATENGRWQLWDLVEGFFHKPSQTLAIGDVTGIVGAPGEIHESRLAVTPGPESGAVDLSALQIVFFGPEETNLSVGLDGTEPATATSDPEDVGPGVFEREGTIDDRYGVAVVDAEQPDNITMTAQTDRYELVVDTSGGTTDAGLDRLAPLVPDDEVGVVVRTRTGQRFETTVEIPTLDGAEVGDRVDLQE